LDAIEREGFDALVHLGDAIGIGPFPAECLDALLNVRNARFVMGNHDEYFARGLAGLRPHEMSGNEMEHQRWTHSMIAPALRPVVAQWPWLIQEDFGTPTTFIHYPRDASGRAFAPLIRSPTPADLDRSFSLFASDASVLNFYGHDHRFSDLEGQARYVNP